MALGPPKEKPKIKRKSYTGVYLGLAILLIVSTATIYFACGDRDRKVEEISNARDERNMIKEPDALPAKVAPSDATNSAVDMVEAPKPPKKLWLGKEVKEHRVVTNNTLIIETFITVDGKMHKYYHDERDKVLPSAADQMLALMTASDDGFGAPPLPVVENFENEFDKIKWHKGHSGELIDKATADRLFKKLIPIIHRSGHVQSYQIEDFIENGWHKAYLD